MYYTVTNGSAAFDTLQESIPHITVYIRKKIDLLGKHSGVKSFLHALHNNNRNNIYHNNNNHQN